MPAPLPRAQVALAGAALIWLALVLATPAIGRPQGGGLPGLASAAVYAAASAVCHQRPDRSFTLQGLPLPVCARCTGLYVGAALAALVAVSRRAGSIASREARQIVLVAAVPTVITLVLEWTGVAALSNALRATAAVPLGAAVSWMLVAVVAPRSPSVEIH